MLSSIVSGIKMIASIALFVLAFVTLVKFNCAAGAIGLFVVFVIGYYVYCEITFFEERSEIIATYRKYKKLISEYFEDIDNRNSALLTLYITVFFCTIVILTFN